MPRIPFIAPSAPVLKPRPPAGPEWLHEVKFDGWRAQLHVAGGAGRLYSRNGNDLTPRFRSIAAALQALPARDAVIDAEAVACDADGMPDFRAIMARRPRTLCAWCFDLLWLDGEDLRTLPLEARRARLEELLAGASDTLRFSEAFADPVALLTECQRLRLEGIVSKRRDQPYRSGPNPGWVKVKSASWRAENRERWKLFEKRRGA